MMLQLHIRTTLASLPILTKIHISFDPCFGCLLEVARNYLPIITIKGLIMLSIL